MKTGVIRYNVKDRGRVHRGVKRNFDTVALAKVINGPEVQEQVKLRDMRGYFGHWPRVMFGMDPGEGGIYDGKQITLEPALVTTALRAFDDGTIEHEAEFLDTVPGRTAKRMFGSKAGGFSSAINCREYAGQDVPVSFHGFDYVYEPNFSTNRGWALDGVFDDASMDRTAVFDTAVRESLGTMKVLDGLYSRLQADYDQACSVITRQAVEISELVGMLAKLGPEAERNAKRRLAALDSATLPRGIATARLDSAPMMRLAREFETMELPGRVPEQPAETPLDAETRGLTSLVSGWFGKR